MKTQEDIDAVFRKAALENELPKNSAFDEAIFWEQLESNLTNQKPSKYQFWYLAAASVLLLVGFLLSWSVFSPTENKIAQLAKISPESKVVREDANHGVAKISPESKVVREDTNHGVAIERRAVREDTNHGILIKSRAVREDTNHGAALAIENKTVREDTNYGVALAIDSKVVREDTNHGAETPNEKSIVVEDINHESGLITQKQKNKKTVKLRIVHANELFDNETVVAQRQESEPPQRFIVINLKLPKSNPEQNLISLIRKK